MKDSRCTCLYFRNYPGCKQDAPAKKDNSPGSRYYLLKSLTP